MNKKVCYTCITGGYDNIPTHKYVDPSWDYVLFTDNPELLKHNKVAHWSVRPLAYKKSTNVKNARWHKINAHILFPEYEYSLWTDGNICINNNNIFVKTNKLIKNNIIVSIPLHPTRNCIYQEAEEIKNLHIDTIKTVGRQMRFLKKKKYPVNNGLSETNIIFRQHNKIKQMLNLWWAMVYKYSKRDQLSYNYCAWRYNIQTQPLYNTPGTHRTNGDFDFIYAPTHNQDKISMNKKPRKQIIISLTSFPDRIQTVHLTIESLINQTKKADKIILWLAPEQFPNKLNDLPKQLLDLQEKGLTIDWYHDIKSYKKLIPTLQKFPNDLIVTVDDDIIYKPTMLRKLYDTNKKHPNDIVCHRATKFIYKKDKFKTIAGGKKFYHGAHYLNKLTDVGGVLYPPNCFHPDVLNENLMMNLAPTNDDQWFWLQAVRNNVGTRVAKDREIDLNYIPNSQKVGLYLQNDQGENLFWKDFERIMNHYPRLAKKLRRTGISTKIFYKERLANKRKIYFLGKQILSYKKKTSFSIQQPTISVRYISEDRLPVFLTDKFYERTGKLPTEHLETFSEKVIWASMFDVTPLKIQCADKLTVRDYVKKTIGEQYLPELYATYKNSDEFNIKDLPKSFVLTYNAGSGQNLIVTDKNLLNPITIKNTIRQWLQYNHSEPFCEMQYRYIPPRVIARELVDIRTDIEYKLWCFGGKAEFIVLNCYSDGHDKIRVKTKSRDWADMDFHQIGHGIIGQIDKQINKPKFLDEMIMIAEKLAKPFDFVRVDFYETNEGKLIFGELTFSPTVGFLEFAPDNDKIQKKYGKMFKTSTLHKKSEQI